MKMATPLLCGVASDNSLPDFIATEDSIIDHRTVLFSGAYWHHICQTLKGQKKNAALIREMVTKSHSSLVAPEHCITAEPFPHLPSFTPGTNHLLK